MSRVWASTSHSRTPIPDCVVAAGPAVAGWLPQVTPQLAPAGRHAQRLERVAVGRRRASRAAASRRPACSPAAPRQREVDERAVVGARLRLDLQDRVAAEVGARRALRDPAVEVRPARALGPAGCTADRRRRRAPARTRRRRRRSRRTAAARRRAGPPAGTASSSAQTARSWAGLPGQQRVRLRRPAVVGQRAEPRIGAGLVAQLAQLAGVGAVDVAAERRDRAGAVAAGRAVRDDRVREEHRAVADEVAAAVVDAAARRGEVAGHGAAARASAATRRAARRRTGRRGCPRRSSSRPSPRRRRR